MIVHVQQRRSFERLASKHYEAESDTEDGDMEELDDGIGIEPKLIRQYHRMSQQELLKLPISLPIISSY